MNKHEIELMFDRVSAVSGKILAGFGRNSAPSDIEGFMARLDQSHSFVRELGQGQELFEAIKADKALRYSLQGAAS